MIRMLLAVALCCAALPALAEQPSATFCWFAKAAVKSAGSEKAAEEVARARGASEETIAKAKRCRRDLGATRSD
jgi:hypothetical protein